MEVSTLIDVCVKLKPKWFLTKYADYEDSRESYYRERLMALEQIHKPYEINSLHPNWNKWVDAVNELNNEFKIWDAPRKEEMLKSLYAEGLPQCIEILQRELGSV